MADLTIPAQLPAGLPGSPGCAYYPERGQHHQTAVLDPEAERGPRGPAPPQTTEGPRLRQGSALELQSQAGTAGTAEQAPRARLDGGMGGSRGRRGAPRGPGGVRDPAGGGEEEGGGRGAGFRAEEPRRGLRGGGGRRRGRRGAGKEGRRTGEGPGDQGCGWAGVEAPRGRLSSGV